MRIRRTVFAVSLATVLEQIVAPWIALDGTNEVYSGVDCMALLVTPVAAYMYGVSPFQAGVVSVGPILILLLAGHHQLPLPPPQVHPMGTSGDAGRGNDYFSRSRRFRGGHALRIDIGDVASRPFSP